MARRRLMHERVPRHHNVCPCCEGSGVHEGGVSCERCDGVGHYRPGRRRPYCPQETTRTRRTR